ncbi:MAG TPA: DUF6549 family protein [Puia sp.]|nr:DUF6549 family protein [Puia sp.]
MLGICCFLLLDRCGKQRTIAQLQNEKAFLTDTVVTYIDAGGLEHAAIPERTLTPSQVKALLPDQVKSLTGKLNAKISDFNNLVTATTQTSQVIETPTIAHDTVYAAGDFAPGFHYHDQWIDIEGTVLKDTVDLKYTIRDSLWFSTYWKRTGWFNKELLLDGFSADPHTTVTGIKGISLDKERRPVRLSLGPVFSYSLINGAFKPTVGVGLQYNLIRF